MTPCGTHLLLETLTSISRKHITYFIALAGFRCFKISTMEKTWPIHFLWPRNKTTATNLLNIEHIKPYKAENLFEACLCEYSASLLIIVEMTWRTCHTFSPINLSPKVNLSCDLTIQGILEYVYYLM